MPMLSATASYSIGRCTADAETGKVVSTAAAANIHLIVVGPNDIAAFLCRNDRQRTSPL
jgi:hypothetical protein